MLKIGWAKREISTNDPVIIPGQFYTRVSQGILDPLFVTALVIDSGDDYVIFLQSDSVSVAKGILKEIREKVKNKISEIDPLKILMNASHTHTGPLLGEGETLSNTAKISELPHDGYEITPPGEYREFYTDMVCEAICEAYQNRDDGYVSYGYGYATVAHSRRVVYSKDLSKCGGGEISSRMVDGHAKMYGRTNDESFSHYEAGTDSYANFLFTFDKNEKLTGAIVNIPCPSQNSEHEWHLSADYWHNVREELKNRYGDIYVLPQCAAAGDLSPRPLHYTKAEERRFKLKFANYEIDPRAEKPTEMYCRRDIALRICDAFDEVYSWASTEKYDDLPLVHSVKDIKLDRRIITDEEYEFCKAQLETYSEREPFVFTGNKREDLKKNSIIISSGSRYKNIIKKYEDQKKDTQITMEMHVIKLGNIAFASNQFELYMDYQHRIQARSPFEQTFVVQLCAQPERRCGSYLATERGVWGMGYSATMYCNLVSPNGGQQLVDETVKELNKIY